MTRVQRALGIAGAIAIVLTATTLRPLPAAGADGAPLLVPTLIAAPDTVPAGAAIDHQTELLFWQSVARADTREMYEGYLNKFGESGQFAFIAHQRIKDLAMAAPGQAMAPTQAPVLSTPVLSAAAVIKECDRLAMAPSAQARPADIVGVEDPDPSVAVPACEAAVRANPGNGRMEYDLARAYYSSRKYPDANRLWEQAARDGNADSYSALAASFFKGEGVPQSYPRAFELFAKGVDSNVANAMVGMGSMYDRGLSVQKDPGKARALYERAIALGSASGLRNLGILYYNGNGVPKDLGIARDYLERAAKLNDQQAIKLLAVMATQPARGQAPRVRVARQTHGVRCPLGSTGGNTAWLVRGMPLNNFHTNNQGQIVGGAPTRCN